MRLGTIVLQARPWAETAEAFRTAEEIGYDVGYVADHLTHATMAGRWLADGFTTLAAAAGVTSRIDVGTLVASATVRSPVPLARAAATVDEVSGGRLVLGLGAGIAGDAVADRGVAPTPRELTDRFEETVRALDALWAGEPAFGGDHAAYRDVVTAAVAPGRSRPFTMLAAHGPRGLALTARYADAWSTYGGPASVALAADDYWALLAEQSAQLTRQCEGQGRDPGTVRRSLLLGYGTVKPLTDVGSYVQAVQRAGQLGFDEVVVYWPDGEPGDRFWSDVEVHGEALARLR